MPHALSLELGCYAMLNCENSKAEKCKSNSCSQKEENNCFSELKSLNTNRHSI